MRLRTALFCAAFLACGSASAAPAETRTTLQMHADGELQIAVDGHVSDCQLKSELSPKLADMVDRKVRSWHFEPIVVDGQPVTARTALHIELTAEPLAGKDAYSVRIANVHFGEPKRSAGTRPPHYPQEAVHVGLGARVLLYVRVDEAGKVVDVQPYQTNLNAKPSSELDAKHWRDVFEQASIAAVKNWHFDLSETLNGKPIGTTAIVPFEYWVVGGPIRKARAGEWQPYLPGPVHPAPWANALPEDGSAVAALKDGQALSLASRFHLKDSVLGSTL